MSFHSFRSRVVRAICGVYLLWATMALAAGPSSDEPEAVFPSGPLPGNLEEHAAAVEAYQHAADLIQRALKKYETSGFKNAMLLEIGKAHTAAVQAHRRINRLTLVGEPASYDPDERIRELHKRLSELREKIVADDAFAKLVAGTRQKWLNEATKQQQKSIPKAEQLAEQKRWEEAAQAVYDPIDKLTPQGWWYDASTQEMGYVPFRPALHRIEPELFAMIHARAIDERRQAIAREMPNFVAIQHDLDAAIQSVAVGGKGNLDGQEQAGPGLLASIGARWRIAQLAAWRTRAHCWGLNQLANESPPELRVLEQENERFTGAMVQACAQLIEADAARAAASDVAGLHREYIAALAPLLEFDHGRLLASGVGQSLDKLAAKSPEFAADLAAYARATSDLLRWRERAAGAQARRYQADFQESVVPLNEILRCNSNSAVAATPASAGTNRAKASSFRCIRRVSDLIAQASPNVVGQRATFGNVTSPAAGGAVAMYDNRHYARLAPGVDLSTTVAELKHCLFAQDASPPLTLQAYTALATAEHGCCEQVGGQIEGFELEAVLTRFADLGDNDWGLVTLGRLPNEGMDLPLRQLLVAFAVKPAWARHRYGFVEIKGE